VPFAQDIRDLMGKALAAIRDGRFDAEWRGEQAAGYPVFKKLRAEADSHPMNRAEEEMRRLLRIKSE
jgi:ketol-acid reductoisomerase